MKKNKNEWKKIKEANYNYEININGQLRNIKSKKIIKPKGYSYRITFNRETIHLGSINELRWKYFKGEITSNLYLRGWKKCNALEKDIKPYYFVNQFGNILNAKLDRHVYPTIKHDGYLRVHLKPRELSLHRLIGLFIPIGKKYDGMSYNELTIDHINRDKKDNRLSNLRWMTLEDNLKESHKVEGRNYNKNRIYKTN